MHSPYRLLQSTNTNTRKRRLQAILSMTSNELKMTSNEPVNNKEKENKRWQFK